MECVVSINILEACPNLISVMLLINVLPVLFLINLLKDSSVMLTSIETSLRLTFLW